MSSWRRKLPGLIFLVLLVLIIVFWGTMLGACIVIALFQGIQFYLFSDFASRDLAKTFQEDGKHVKGWR